MCARRAEASVKVEALVVTERRVQRDEQPPELSARVDRPMVCRKPCSRMKAPLEALFRGLADVVDVREETACEGVYIFPTAEDRTVHQDRRIEAQRFGENPGRRVLDARDEQEPSGRELAHEIGPGKLGNTGDTSAGERFVFLNAHCKAGKLQVAGQSEQAGAGEWPVLRLSLPPFRRAHVNDVEALRVPWEPIDRHARRIREIRKADRSKRRIRRKDAARIAQAVAPAFAERQIVEAAIAVARKMAVAGKADKAKTLAAQARKKLEPARRDDRRVKRDPVGLTPVLIDHEGKGPGDLADRLRRGGTPRRIGGEAPTKNSFPRRLRTEASHGELH